MKKNIYLSLKKTTNLLVGHLGWISLVFTTSFSSLGLAKENERLNQNRLAVMMKEAGLDQQITLAEFWKNTKKFYPAWLVPQLDKFVKNNGNRLMPEVQISSMKSSDGSIVPVLRLTEGGKTTTLQFYGEKDKYLKFNNVKISEYDLSRVDDVFTRLVTSDYNLRKQAEAVYFKNSPNQSSKVGKKTTSAENFNFQKFPRVTPQLWKSITPEQRVGYIIKMRRLHQSAVAVLATQNKPKKTSSLDIELFYKTIFGEDAFAQKAASTAPFSGQCIVAGYVGSYGPGRNVNGQQASMCDVDLALKDKSYENLKFVTKANSDCAATNGANSIACNPLIYGYPKGKPSCVDKLSAAFQPATHFKGPCEKDSPLSKTEFDITQLSPEARKKAIEAEQKTDYQESKNFLEGVLASKDPVLLDAFKNGKWSHALDTELVRIQNQFEDEITKSIDICTSKFAATGGKKDEPRQKGACDQLHRRWLFADRFISQFRAQGCLDGSKYIWELKDTDYSSAKDNETVAFRNNKTQIESIGSNLCECPNKKKVSFNEHCDLSAIGSTELSSDPVKFALVCSERNGNIKGIDENNPCQCKNGSEPKPAKKGSFFSNIFSNGDSKVDSEERTCDEDGNKWLIPGLALAAIIGVLIFTRDKDPKPVVPPVVPPTPPIPTPKPPIVITPPTPVIPPVVQPPAPTCDVPKVPSAGGCICGNVQECASNQRMMDYLTCQCGPATPQQPDITCPDGSLSASLANCAKCSNGSYVTPMGCSEGGSGSNPNGGGAGGLPPKTAQ